MEVNENKGINRGRSVAVIPARGGSKGIPRKNMRLMHGKPLISYAIENALNCSLISTVIVTSDSEEILAYASQFDGVICLDRSSELAQDAVTLDPVIYDAVVRCEDKLGIKYDTVVTLQPTSPLLSVDTLTRALQSFTNNEADSMISVVNAPHLRWKRDDKGRIVQDYIKRLNRQQLPPSYLETGAFFICKRSCLTPNSRLGKKVSVFEVPENEATDIDTKEDWVVCESILSRKTIAFRVDGYKSLGLGHVYRALTIAYYLVEHNVVFLCNSKHREGIDKLQSSNMSVVEFSDNQELLDWLQVNKPDVFVNDCLDTSAEYVELIKQYVERFVSFEDLGPGSQVADAVVNAIYEGAPDHRHIYTGKEYVCLRDEFLTSVPVTFSDEVKRILVMFGGTDPLDLSARLYSYAEKRVISSGDVVFDFILGSGYSGKLSADDAISGIEIYSDVVRVSDHMRKADLAISSQGRTTFELASMGVPTIVLAQNKREQLHTFAQMDNGFINLGLGGEVSDEDIAAAVEWIISSKSIRSEMHRLMLANDLKSGIRRVKRIILGEE